MSPSDLLAAASIAYAVTNLGSLTALRALMETLGPLEKLGRCPFCVGFWAGMAVPAAQVWPLEVFLAGVGGAILGPLMVLGLFRWGWRLTWPGALLGALMGVLGAGAVVPLVMGAPPALLALRGFEGALASLAMATAINAGMAYVASQDPDEF